MSHLSYDRRSGGMHLLALREPTQAEFIANQLKMVVKRRPKAEITVRKFSWEGRK
jgi:hypothetical protein